MADEVDEVPGKLPIVFQCLQCYRVVSDSLALVSADEELRTITVQGACNIVRSPRTRTSDDGKDMGSTYHELFCASCNARLGRLYLTTAPHLDGIRNMFTFDTDSLVSFELGRYDHQCEGGLTSHGSATAAQAPASDPADATLDGRNLPAEMTKLQGMLLLFHERICSLEKHLGAGEASGRAEEEGGSSSSRGSRQEVEGPAGTGRKRRSWERA